MKQGRAFMVVLVLVITLAVGLGVFHAMRTGQRWRQERVKASAVRECSTNLKALFVAEKSYFAEYDAFTVDLAKVGFSPERGNRFAYIASLDGGVEDRSTHVMKISPGNSIVGVDEFRFPGRSTAALLARLPRQRATGAEPGVSGTCPTCEFVGLCVGNLDDDADVHVMSVATYARTLPDGGAVPAGLPVEEVSDF